MGCRQPSGRLCMQEQPSIRSSSKPKTARPARTQKATQTNTKEFNSIQFNSHNTWCQLNPNDVLQRLSVFVFLSAAEAVSSTRKNVTWRQIQYQSKWQKLSTKFQQHLMMLVQPSKGPVSEVCSHKQLKPSRLQTTRKIYHVHFRTKKVKRRGGVKGSGGSAGGSFSQWFDLFDLLCILKTYLLQTST